MTPTGWLSLAGLAYTVAIATILGSGIWSWLMSRIPAGVVAPSSMLVPIVGMTRPGSPAVRRNRVASD